MYVPPVMSSIRIITHSNEMLFSGLSSYGIFQMKKNYDNFHSYYTPIKSFECSLDLYHRSDFNFYPNHGLG